MTVSGTVLNTSDDFISRTHESLQCGSYMRVQLLAGRDFCINPTNVIERQVCNFDMQCCLKKDLSLNTYSSAIINPSDNRTARRVWVREVGGDLGVTLVITCI